MRVVIAKGSSLLPKMMIMLPLVSSQVLLLVTWSVFILLVPQASGHIIQQKSGVEEQRGNTSPCSLSTGEFCKQTGMDMETYKKTTIKEDILRKLGLDPNNLPNVTRSDIPRSADVLELYGKVQLQGDSPEIVDHEDDDRATTQKILIFSNVSGEQRAFFKVD